MKSLITSILALLTCSASFAQTGTINGYVKDKQNAPVSYANILLLLSKDSSIVKGNMADDNGFFSFENVPSNDYMLSVSQIGLKKYFTEKFSIDEQHTTKNIGTISMDSEASTLKEVVVSSQVPLFERKPDKTLVNVSSDLTAGGSTALDILKKSPGVIVDKDGNISLRGKSGVMVMVDGKQTFLSSEQLTSMLNAMSAEQINQIELITNPSSKYDAEGTAGIINIKLKKSKLHGTNGNFSLGYVQGVYDRENGNININHRNERLNAFGNYSANSRTNFNRILIERRFKKDGEINSIFNQDSWIKTMEQVHSVKTGVDFFINENNTIGMVVNGNYNPEDRIGTNYTGIYDRNKNLSSAVNTTNNNEVMFGNYSLNLNYETKLDTTGTQFNVDLDYAQFATENKGNFFYINYDSISNPVNANMIKNNAQSKIDISSFKADLVKPFRKGWKLESGIKSSFVNTDNDVKYFNVKNEEDILDTTKTNHFNYGENIHAVYGIMSKEWKKVTLQLGLRGEQTITKGYQQANDSSFTRSYFQAFPTASLSFIPGEKHEWGVSYSRRIDRPDYQDMNPFRFFLDQYTYEQGNPFLKPQFSNNYELSYTFMKFVSGVLSYSRTRDNITDITRQNDSTHVTYINKENLDINDNYSFTLSLPVPVGKWLTSNNSITTFYNFFNSAFADSTIKQGSLAYVISSSNQVQLKHNFSVQVDFNYTSAMLYGIFKMEPRYGLSLALQKKVLHDRGKIKLSVQNIVRNRYMSADVKFQNMDFNFKQERDNQFVSLSFSYKFGKTTVASSRKHTTGADDEKNRVKKGN